MSLVYRKEGETVNNYIIETLESLKVYIPKLIDANDKLIQLFREENTLKAFEFFPSYVEGLDWVFQAVVLINKQESIFTFDQESINSFLDEINEGLHLSDFVKIADILEYEISPILKDIFILAKGVNPLGN